MPLPPPHYHHTAATITILYQPTTPPKLVLTGFIGVADGVEVPEREDAGVEEVTCIATLQHLLGPEKVGQGSAHRPHRPRRPHRSHPHTAQAVAKLVRVPGLEWQTSFMDEERRKWHERKMVGGGLTQLP